MADQDCARESRRPFFIFALRAGTAAGALGIALSCAGSAYAAAPAGQVAKVDPRDPTANTAATATPAAGTQTNAGAQAAAPATPGDIVVTGYRASLQSALSQKRRSDQIIDAITADDIASFPDANLAESIQRLPGVSIDRDNGEGRTITIRGLGGDFQQVRLNGADAISAAGGNSSDSGGNRTRAFDFNTFASELFGGVSITKTVAAQNDEGSLGAIVDLNTGRPLSIKGTKLSLNAEDEYRENGKTHNPRLTGLFSTHITPKLAILGSIAYQHDEQTIDRYQRSIGVFDYVYRNSQHNGKSPAVYGFAQPSTAGTGATYGSDPAAYALITPTTLIPALPSIGRQDLRYDRLGATATIQWRPTSHTEIIVDGVYSRYKQDSTNYGITPIGLNRNGTNTRVQQNTLRAPNTANGLADRLAIYASCAQSATVDCGQSLNGTTLVPGTRNSYNPNNLDPYDYYNSTVSPGYIASANQTAYYAELIGRPNTRIRAADVNAAGEADYMVLDNVDWRSSADAQYGTTVFKQATVNFRQDFASNFRAEGTAGYSQSEFNAIGLLSEFNAIDQNNYVFDDRAGGKMPIFSPGFDVANPNSWTLVKGLSTIRYFNTYVDDTFKVGRLNFTWEFRPELSLRFGGTWKEFGYSSNQTRRSQSIEAINPTLQEAHLSITDLGQTVGFGQGLNVSPGTPTSFYAPDLSKFINTFGIDCNCINKWGDFRGVADGRQNQGVTERDLSGFVQVDFNTQLLGGTLRGNAGVRVAKTRVSGTGAVGGTDGVAGLLVVAHNEYTDWLPSTNINWEPMRNFLVRFAASKTISRPLLQNLVPGTTSFSSGLSSNGTAPSVTVGNPYLSPFRSTNFDLSFERYFHRDGLFAVTLFTKKIDSFPQQLAGEAPLSSVFEPAVYQQVLAGITSPTLLAYTQNNGVWAIRQFHDAPGGTIRGVEVDFQTNFYFLPGFLKNFGVIANYTHISSKLNYLTGSTTATTQGASASTAANSFAEGPFLNTSPDAFNATLYYETKKWSIRVSGAYRTRYVNRFPLSTGTCSVGTTTNGGAACNSPVLADFGYNENQFNLDAVFGLNVTPWARFTLEARNLTNAPIYRTEYSAAPVTQVYGSTGRIITAGLHLTL